MSLGDSESTQISDGSMVWTFKNLYVQINFNVNEIELTVFRKNSCLFEMMSNFSLWTYEDISHEAAIPSQPRAKEARVTFFTFFSFTETSSWVKADTCRLFSCEQSVCKQALQLCMFMSPLSAVGPQALLCSACPDHALILEIYRHCCTIVPSC